VRQEREVVFAAIRVDGTAGAAALRDRVPRVTRGLDQVDQRGMVQARMVPVAGDAEGARAHDGDVVRLGRIRDGRPTFGERVLVCELRHVWGGTVDLVQILALHEDDDELVEIAGGARGNGARTKPVTGSGEG